MMTGAELADPGNLEDLVSGRTNAFIALREGWVSEEVIGRVKEGLERADTVYLYPISRIKCPKDAVLRINKDGTAEYVGSSWGVFDDSNKALTFDTQGNITLQTRGLRYFFLTADGHLPWQKAARKVYEENITLATSLINENMADLAKRTGGIEVYLEGPEGLALIHGKKVMPVQIEGNEKFLTGANVTALQVLAHYLEANALLSYAQASPARATPVVITPGT